MKARGSICLAFVLGGVLMNGLIAAQNSTNSPAEMFAILPPIPNADPSLRHPVPVRIPTKLKIERIPGTLSATIDTNWFNATNLTVGANMVTGVEYKLFVYGVGEKKPINGPVGLEGGLAFNFGVSYWHAKSDNIPLPGRKYLVEMDLAAFETDIPPQHEWDPQGSKNYKVLWRGTLKQMVDNTTPESSNLTKQISTVLTECQKIGLGMTRAELLKVFTTEGGLSTAARRTFVYQGCPYIKVDVDFTPPDPKQKMVEERATDIIRKISKPYLDWSVSD